MIVTNNTPLSTTLPASVALVSVIGTGVSAARSDHVHADIAAPLFFDLLQTAFRTPRKLLALFTTVPVATTFDAVTYINDKTGVGFVHTNSTSSLLSLGTPTSLLLESYTAQVSGAAGTDMYSGGVSAGNAFFGSTAPNKNPRMSIRWFAGASDANLTRTFAGFVAAATNPGSATASGAYLQAATTGNLFFVTRQGASQTTTDLGARPTALTSYEIETTDAGVTWTCRNVTTSTVVATHTTNVPTATVAIAYYIGGTSGSGSLPTHNVAYCEVDANTVA